MPAHYTRSTVSAAAWCKKCQRQTQHRVDDRRLGPCMECMALADEKHNSPTPIAATKQAALFGETT